MSQFPPRHSYSRISTFAECERRFLHEAITPDSFDSDPIKLGHHVHEALEWVARLMTQGIAAEEAVATVVANPPEGFLGLPALEDYLQRALPVLQTIKPVSAEEWFRDIGPLKMVGKIDLVSSCTPEGEERPCVLDWKTTGSPHKAFMLESSMRSSLQLKIYCLAKGCVDAGYAFLFPTGPVRVKTIRYTKPELEVARRWLGGTMEVIQGRWAEARSSAERSPEANGLLTGPDGRVYDSKVFSLATPSYPFCSAKWCPFWDKCIGKATP